MRKILESYVRGRIVLILTVAVAVFPGPGPGHGQMAALKGNAKNPEPSQSEAGKDPLGRTTPRGTVLGFLVAAHKKNYELAAEYLAPHVQQGDPKELAEQFAFVLDKRLPAQLNRVSDNPEGSVRDPINPNREVVGTIESNGEGIEIAVERINDPKLGKIWFFSPDTLKRVPSLFDETNASGLSTFVPQILMAHRVVGIPLFEWMLVLLGIPLLYVFTFLLDRGLGLLVRFARRRREKGEESGRLEVLSAPGRLLLIALTMLALRTELTISLFARQFWTDTARVLMLGALSWILIRVAARAEKFIDKRLRSRKLEGTASVVRLVRRLADVLIIFATIVAMLYTFGVNPSPALAGLGVGGIAVALAAQKTLENVIGGASIILDQAVKVGDALKFGTVEGTVEEIGLRSTVVRTPQRTLVSVPNGQLATVFIETTSARDKFWFHPTVSLEHGTSAEQMELILRNLSAFLRSNSRVEQETIRVRFIALGAYSLDIEVFAYVLAPNWEGFLTVQQELLLGLMQIVERAGSRIALPSQVVLRGRELAGPETTATVSRPEESPVQAEGVR